MADDSPAEDHDLVAGNFSPWLSDMQAALRGERDSDVPCGGCTACCRSSQFVHIAPEETDTLAHIPAELLFPAPRLPPGHRLLGYDERGHCPMLIEDRCSIYEHRPRTCRTYDCRIFPAVGLDVDAEDKPLIADRTRRWKFTVSTEGDRADLGAVRAAAAFIVANPGVVSDVASPTTTSQLAVLAIRVHDVFLEQDAGRGELADGELDPELLLQVARRLRS